MLLFFELLFALFFFLPRWGVADDSGVIVSARVFRRRLASDISDTSVVRPPEVLILLVERRSGLSLLADDEERRRRGDDEGVPIDVVAAAASAVSTEGEGLREGEREFANDW